MSAKQPSHRRPAVKKKRKLELSDERIAHIVRELAREYQNSLERRLLAHGVSFGFWAYLRELWNDDGTSQRDLSDRLGLAGPTTHSVIKRMEKAGLVELRPIREDKPRRLVYLSRRGRELRTVLEPLAEEVNALAVEGISSDRLRELRSDLLRIHENLFADTTAQS